MTPQEHIKKLEDELAALKDSLAKKKDTLEWPRVEEYQQYFAWTDEGVGVFTEYVQPTDEESYNSGNYFLTRKDAEYFARRWKARQRYERLAAVENGGRLYEFDSDNVNWFVMADQTGTVIGFGSSYNYGVIYFPTRTAAERVLAALSAEEKHILFGAPL